VEIVRNEIILPKDYNFFFLEPGVEQVCTYVTKTPDSTKYILFHAEFEYDQFTPHKTERVFAIKVGSADKKPLAGLVGHDLLNIPTSPDF
jgi:hypothetical protein